MTDVWLICNRRWKPLDNLWPLNQPTNQPITHVFKSYVTTQVLNSTQSIRVKSKIDAAWSDSTEGLRVEWTRLGLAISILNVWCIILPNWALSENRLRNISTVPPKVSILSIQNALVAQTDIGRKTLHAFWTDRSGTWLKDTIFWGLQSVWRHFDQ